MNIVRIVVFEQNGSGSHKISGIQRYGRGLEISRRITIDQALPEFVDDPEEYIPADFEADLVLDYLRHPDLSHYLARVCADRGIPLVASGKKSETALTPFTCCGLGHHRRLGIYGEQFGFPEFRVTLDGDRIADLEVLRGAPCGETWEVAPLVIGMEVEEALSFLPREIQYRCSADPSGFDPVTGKSPLHYAGYVHRAALRKAVDQARQEQG
ncbi:MAG TPA: hypothetical protein ENK27_13615 [Desulfobulbus sp.]|nr:hypothetical protein [Desulfobulbus sp.]